MSAHTTVNRPVRTSHATLARPVVTVELDDQSTDEAYELATHELVFDESLVEEVSIDGMCGVY